MRVGFVGLGNMGEGMAWNLATKGFELTVRDLRPEPVARLEAEGAHGSTTNEEIGRRSDIVCVAVFDDQQIFETVFPHGDDAGVLAGMAPGGTIILHPTTPPSVIRRVADSASERNIAVLDAPMTGGAHVAARAGTLTFMVGGEADVLERVRPVLGAMATSVFHVGPLGAGAAAKIINNYLGVSHTIAVREALRLATLTGIGEEAILRILNTGDVGSNWATRNWERIKTQEASYTTGRAGMVAMATKDMMLAQRLAIEVGADTPALHLMIEKSLPDIARSGLTDNGLD
jgi:3-hydroxyisobutyrate dehydrogenase-like beta-hydroxyacid dehydrogenase